MSLGRRASDTLIGLLVVSALAILIVAVIFTQGWNERRIDMYMLTSSAQDLNNNTKVLLQGLEVGRIVAMSPQVDPSMGPPTFVATLRLREKYQNGVPLVLPVGTSADIQTPSLGSAYIALKIPVRPYPVGALRPGDTIPSTRQPAALEAIVRVADSLNQQVQKVLADARLLLTKLGRTADVASSELASTGPEVRHALTDLQSTLAEMRPALAQATSLMASADSRLGGLHDSITATLADTRRLVDHLDTLSVTATTMARDNEPEIRATINNLLQVSAKLDHFMDQVSRRPLRMIGGVRPLPPESLPPKPIQ